MTHIQTTTTKDRETIQISLGEIGIKVIMQIAAKAETITKSLIRIKDLKAKVSDNNRHKSKVVEAVARRILRKCLKDLCLDKKQFRRSSRLQSKIWRIRWVKWQNSCQNDTQVSFLLILKSLEVKMLML